MARDCSNPRYVRAEGSDEDARLDGYKPHAQLRGEVTPEQFFCLVRFQLAGRMSPEEEATSYPDRFEGGPGFGETGFQELKQKMCERHPLDAVYVDVDIEEGKPTGHEGRHRSAAAHSLGIGKVPAVIFVKDAFEMHREGIEGLPERDLAALDRILSRCGIERDGRSVG